MKSNLRKILFGLSLFGGISLPLDRVMAQGSLTPPGVPSATMKTLDQVEPRTKISSLPFVITNSGSYYLAGNLNGGGSGAGVLIQASGVTIDLRNFSIQNCTIGISAAAGLQNISVQNGLVRNCVGAGLDLGVALRCSVANVIAAENGGTGIAVGSGSVVSLSTASANTGPGFFLGDGSEIFNCVAQSNRIDGIELSKDCLAHENDCSANGNGSANQGGIVLFGNGSRAEGNNCSRNNGFGIRATGTNNLIVRNTACGNITSDFSIAAGNHYGQVQVNPGDAFGSGNPWANFSCSQTPNFCQTSADCNDTNACTTDTCVENVCVHTALTCNDNNPCTTDACNPASGCFFVNVANGVACSDNSLCTTNDSCQNGVCVGSTITCPGSANVCLTAACNPASGCGFVNNSASCNDGNPCTVNDVCSGGTCGGTAKNCSDGNPCTDDLCNTGTGACFYVNNTASCSDGNACTTGDVCSGGVCQAGTGALNCNDNNACTTDTCNPVSGCVHANVANGATCSDNNVCTGGDACQNGACVGTNIICPGSPNICKSAICIPATGCGFANNTAACDDGNPCTINDHCSSGTCLAGTAKVCSDNNPCTTDSCNVSTGACVYTTNTASCNDGNACTVGDFCSSGTCQSGTTALTCNDNNPCTVDSCNPAAGCTYTNLPNGATCNGSGFCFNGVCN